MPFMPEPVHITMPASSVDPRTFAAPPGVVVHHVPELHPDDVTVIGGLRCTSVSRTLIDCAECMDEWELRECFANVRAQGRLDPDALNAARARVEWRPSLYLVDRLIDEFCG